MIIYLFTDFSFQGPYVGELKAVLARAVSAGQPIIDLMHDAPLYDPESSAYLLAALSSRFQPGDVCLGVVDPGVGDPGRRPVIVEVDGVTYCGPDNGLFSQIIKKARIVKAYEIAWQPGDISNSFHGRDIFAPALLKYLNQEDLLLEPIPETVLVGNEWPAECSKVIYIDGFGNLITGLKPESLTTKSVIIISEHQVHYADTFSSSPSGSAFWYVNSMGLIEIAVNQRCADKDFQAKIGTELSVVK